MDEKLRLKYFFQTENVPLCNCTPTLLLNEEKQKRLSSLLPEKPKREVW